MKNFPLIPLLMVITLLGCQKDNQPTIENTPLLLIKIQTEACFNPYCRTLILAHPDDNYYYKDEKRYKVEWFKADNYLKAGTRLNCVGAGVYQAKITFLQMDSIKSVSHELVSSPESK